MAGLTKKKNCFEKAADKHYEYLKKDKDFMFKDRKSESKYKSSYKYFHDLIYEDFVGKNGKDNKIIEFEAKNYEEYTISHWNAFFIRNVIHQLFNREINTIFDIKEVINDISNCDLLSQIKNKCWKIDKAKDDAKHYFSNYKMLEIIKMLSLL